MQANYKPDPKKEVLCIKTKKVYDWIINEADFKFSDVRVEIPGSPGICVPAAEILNVTCDVKKIDIKEVEGTRVDRDFIIDGKLVTLQEVTLEKKITLTVSVTVDPPGEGNPIETRTSEPFDLIRMEKVILCAPDGTKVSAEVTNDVDCMINGFRCVQGDGNRLIDVSLSIFICQSIQVTFPVVLEVEADFCEPRDALPTPVCSAPILPKQCPTLFPDDDKKHDRKR